jgi:hypothetical protein
MTTLHLGVTDIPYATAVPTKGRRAASTGGQTTGDVAEILEDKYHIMEIFFEEHQKEIAVAVEESIGDALETLLSGHSPGGNATAAASADIETLFKRFISNGEMDSLGYPGVPTAAALAGVNHRLAHPYAKGNAARVSFRDTGLYEASFKAWID